MYQGQKVKSEASYFVKEYADGQLYIMTSVTWGVKRGRFVHYQSRNGTINEPTRFKSWAKKYGIFDCQAESVLSKMKAKCIRH